MFSELSSSRELIKENLLIFGFKDVASRVCQFEDSIDDGQLSCCRLSAAEGLPVVDHNTCGNHITSTVDCTCAERNLNQTRKGVKFCNGCQWVHQTTLVRQSAVGANQGLTCDGCLENFHSQNILHDLFGNFVNFGM